MMEKQSAVVFGLMVLFRAALSEKIPASVIQKLEPMAIEALKDAAMMYQPFRAAAAVLNLVPNAVLARIPILKHFQHKENPGEKVLSSAMKAMLTKLYTTDKIMQTPKGKSLMGEPAPNGMFYNNNGALIPIDNAFHPVDQLPGVYYQPSTQKFFHDPNQKHGTSEIPGKQNGASIKTKTQQKKEARNKESKKKKQKKRKGY